MTERKCNVSFKFICVMSKMKNVTSVSSLLGYTGETKVFFFWSHQRKEEKTKFCEKKTEVVLPGSVFSGPESFRNKHPDFLHAVCPSMCCSVLQPETEITANEWFHMSGVFRKMHLCLESQGFVGCANATGWPGKAYHCLSARFLLFPGCSSRHSQWCCVCSYLCI